MVLPKSKSLRTMDPLQISGQDCKSENLEVGGGDWYTSQSLKARQAEVLGSRAGGSKWMTHPWEKKDQLCTSLRALSRPSADQSHHSLSDGGSSLSVHRLKGQSPPYSNQETTLYQLLEYPIIQSGWYLKLSTTVCNIMLIIVNTHKISCLTHLFG